MRRLLAIALALVSLIAAGFLWMRDRPVAVAAPPMPALAHAETMDAPPPIKAPKARITDADREARRFNRYDKDKDERIDRAEYLANRKKAYVKLDLNKDGRLDFDENSAATMRKLNKADHNRDGVLSRDEFATTAVKRKPKPECKCETPDD